MGDGSAAPRLDDALNRKPKILFIMNDLVTYRDRLIFLVSQGIAVKAAAEVKNALEIISKELPDVIFISWDLKATNVKKLYELFSKQHGYLCVVFSENNSPLRVSAMLNSGLPYLILPPVSGKSILEKFNQLKGDQDTYVENLTQISVSHLPKDGQWEILINKKGQNPIWRLIHEDREYFVQAKTQPQYDVKQKKWINLLENHGYKLLKAELTTKNSANFRLLEGALTLTSEISVQSMVNRLGGVVGTETDLAKTGMAKVVESNVIPSETKLSEKSKAPETVIAKSVEVAVELSVERTSETVKPIDKVSKGTLTMVQTGNFKGYIVGANGSNTSDEALAGKVRGHLTRILDKKGVDVGGDVTVRSLELDEVPFKIWAEQHSEFIISSQHGSDEVAFAYFKSNTIMERPDGNTEVFKTDVQKGLVTDKPVEFDVFLHLPKNKKFVQYLNKGTVLTAAMKAKIMAQGITEIFIKNEQFPDYEIYCTKNTIDASIASFKAKLADSTAAASAPTNAAVGSAAAATSAASAAAAGSASSAATATSAAKPDGSGDGTPSQGDDPNKKS